MARNRTPLSFLGGFVQGRDVLRVIAIDDAGAEHGSTLSLLMKWTREGGEWSHFKVDWTVTNLFLRPEGPIEMYASGNEGEVLVGSADGQALERVARGKTGPLARGAIRCMRWIGEHLYVAGMSRQVYRRDGPATWSRRDEGTVLPVGRAAPKGFNAIGGVTEADIFAVGFDGEIWRCKKGRWERIDSPTNVVLTELRCISPDLAYACGQGGTLLRGRGDEWEVIEHGGPRDDLWGMEWFGGKLYLASDNALHVLNRDDELEPVKLDLRGTPTCMHLHANDGVMLSVGSKHVAWTEDAARWHDITPRAD